ncbi:integrase catalytic domain-containing protein [Nostoc cycadae]|uniref:Transposase n=1 Tax=Nostoc cycadae WK-1 TaxID=1861711 RepID=A0A2H6LIZ4_9NOSO|nr:DDE-type integrase/transposase/recombinase [Nostoc cycadae]GBE93169.1 transposase [Nostoc cycadae WK-1]
MFFDSNRNREGTQENIGDGWQGQNLQASHRETLDSLYSNYVWQCDHFQLNIMLAAHNTKLFARPYLTKITDVYSRCIMGIHLSFDAPNCQVVALALRHAIFPKQYGKEYALHYQWQTFGVPKFIVTDSSKHFKTKYLKQIAKKLDFEWINSFSAMNSATEERSILAINSELLSNLPEYCVSYSAGTHIKGENKSYLTLQELHLLLVNYIVNNYNQKVDNFIQNQTRFQRWETGLLASPNIVNEEDLNIYINN